ncbi:MAG: hypothetical protein AB7N71_06540 [Phycisphaerae bacterium]
MPEVQFWIHSDPTDPNSSIDIKIILSLQEGDRTGDSVGWKITSAAFDDLMASPARRWSVADPPVPSLDGLWWVKHSDPDNPQPREFRNPPHLEGTAVADIPVDPNLSYDFEGKGVSTINPWTITALLDYSFKELGQSNPIKAEVDEPVEVPDTPTN